MEPSTIGEYRLLQELGKGAAGRVYLATPTIPKRFAKPGEPVALKIYRDEILEERNQLERIKREFDVGSTLNHPNLVRVFEYASNVAQPYLVMQYVDGITLAEWLEMFHPPSGRLLLRIVDELLRAVGELHSHSIIHRDLKAQNVMMTSSFHSVVMDFGVIKNLDLTRITSGGKLLGTPVYAAPEVLRREECDHRADVYSLGALFHELLTGQRIFEGVKREDLLHAKEAGGSDLDSTIEGRDEITAALYQVTRQMLEANPNDRPQTVRAVEEILTPIFERHTADDEMVPLHGYIATALTGLEPESRDAIAFTSSRIADVAKEQGIYVYQPRKATDPLLHPDVDPEVVYLTDRRRVVAADVVVVLANKPSFGVGQELEIAAGHGKPIILLAREGVKVSRMVTGCLASVEMISYQTPEELARRLAACLRRLAPEIRAHRRLSAVRVTSEIGHRIAAARIANGLDTSEELADGCGLPVRLVKAVETGTLENVGIATLERICRFLQIKVRDVVSEEGLPPSVRPIGNLDRLRRVARRSAWSAADYLDLREELDRELAARGGSVIVSEEEWMKRRIALEQRRFRNSQARSKTPTLFEAAESDASTESTE